MTIWDGMKIRVGNILLPVPGPLWQRQLRGSSRNELARLRRMPPDHRRVRAYVVAEMPSAGRPLTTADIAEKLGLSNDTAATILAELESGMTYLYRDQGGAVEWAYPVTAAATPHRLTFDTGEVIWGA